MRLKHLSIQLIVTGILSFFFFFSSTVLAGLEKPGFLVIAPDRGYLGNKEIEDIFASFSKENLSGLVFVSMLDEFDAPMQNAFKTSVRRLQKGGAKKIVLIPLVLSPQDPHLKKALRILGLQSSTSALSPNLQWTTAPAMSEDYRIAQVLEDRARALSQDPSNERLVILGYGAMNQGEEKEIQVSLSNLVDEMHLSFKDTQILVMYHANADEEVRKKNDEFLAASLKEIGSKEDLKPILLSFDLGFKHTGAMQLSRVVQSMIEGLPIKFGDQGMIPHPNALYWMKAAANRYIPVTTDQLGVVIMAHGAGYYINQRINETILPLKKKFTIEIAFGMGESDELEGAILRLESKGIRRIHIVRLFDNSFSFKESTEYIIGARKEPPGHLHGGLPRRVRTGAILSTSGGLDADPLISEVLKKRIMEVSKIPEKETVILLAHGAGSDRQNDLWLKNLKTRAEYIHEKLPKPVKEIEVATIREDWPEKRDSAIQEIRELIQEGNKNGGRVLVISVRIAGAGPYQKYLKGEEYIFNGTGIAPDPNLTQWIDQQINKWRNNLN